MTLWIVRVAHIVSVFVGPQVHYIEHFLLSHFRVLTKTVWAQLYSYSGPFPAKAPFPKFIKLNGFACKTHEKISLKEPSRSFSLLPSFACDAFRLLLFSFLSFSLQIKARAIDVRFENPLFIFNPIYLHLLQPTLSQITSIDKVSAQPSFLRFQSS